jgi:hypothetical protein
MTSLRYRYDSLQAGLREVEGGECRGNYVNNNPGITEN